MESSEKEHNPYVQLLDTNVYEQDESITADIMEIHEDNTEEASEQIMHEIITITNENDVNMIDNYEEIQYVEAEVEIDQQTMIHDDDNHTIFIHEGRRYMIPTEQLSNGNHTIILDEEDGQLIQQDDENTEENHDGNTEDNNQEIYYTDIDEHITSPAGFDESNDNLMMNTQTLIGRQFAVLKDGKLHVTNMESNEMQVKLRQLESTLTNYEEIDATESSNDLNHQDELEEIIDDKQLDDDHLLSGITGKNLITGQTISLSGILEKMRRKNDVNELLNTPSKQRCNSSVTEEPQDYILVPPVARRVVVGRTQDGKRLVGRILQIQKKIQPHLQLKINQSSQNTFTITMPTKRNIKTRKKQQQQQHESILKHSPGSSVKTLKHMIAGNDDQTTKSNPIVQLRYVTRSTLDENVARTLAGLMDLESINKRLKGHRLIVRHIQRRSNDGKIVTGSKRIAYYCGRMKRSSLADNWTFIQEYPAKGIDENEIDLPTSNNDGNNSGDHVNLRVSDDGRTILSDGGETGTTKTPEHSDNETDETITLYLTETQDEYGKKKTKVTIPQLVNNHASNATAVASSSSSIITSGLSSLSNKTNRSIYDLAKINDHFCQHCGKKFQTLGSLKRHASVHDHSLRPLQCMTCLGRFTDESSLRKHMILHTGLRPHKCRMCDKSFAHRGDLNFHLRTHDPVKRYECNVCKKQFNRHSNMLRHSEIHRPHYHNNINNNNNNNSNSNIDVDKTETNNQSSVIILNTEVLQQQQQQETEQIYDGEKSQTNKAPFTCDQCGIQYNFSSSLTRHIVNVHMKPETNDP